MRRRYPMPEHEYFERLSSLAAIGDLSAAEFAELKSHLRECASCQAAYGEFMELADNHLPLADCGPGSSGVSPSEGLRATVLRRAAQEGLRISPEALRGPVGVRKRLITKLEDARWAILPRASHLG